MKRTMAAMLMVMAMAQVLAADEVQSAAPVPKHLELARELVATVKPENNQYNLLGKGVRWKGDLFTSENVVDASCATFVSSLLEKAKAPALKQIESKTYWRSLLRVNNFIEGTERGLGMSKIANINDVEPGDLFMFVCLDNGGCIMSQGVGQGHITVVDVKPVKRASTPPIVSDTIQWTVTVIDAAERPHNRDDTRWTAQGEPKRTGVGRGSYRIYTNLEGVPVGYTTGFGPKYFDVVTRPITIGRVLPY